MKVAIDDHMTKGYCNDVIASQVLSAQIIIMCLWGIYDGQNLKDQFQVPLIQHH